MATIRQKIKQAIENGEIEFQINERRGGSYEVEASLPLYAASRKNGLPFSAKSYPIVDEHTAEIALTIAKMEDLSSCTSWSDVSDLLHRATDRYTEKGRTRYLF